MEKTIVLVALRGYGIYGSRKRLIQKMQISGFKIVVLASEDKYTQKLQDMGVECVNIPFKRGGFSLFRDIKAVIALMKAYKDFF